ncbi:MAG: hypothetical protein A2Y92_05710 [Chloroflexi bacterium RBG_13_57_8]|nr:MAG: hypothetical protein A2Y92_05710 [Chloroflexi bacterium RBG_13_57_8]
MNSMANQCVLHNIRILDFSWVLAGPYATRLLADFGAEVIKIQPLISGEAEDEFSRGYYDTWNRNKLGITLDLSKPEGIALVKKLAGISDAVVENFSPRVMENWGLDYDIFKKIKPDIIMVSLSLMGRKGARRDYSGYGPAVHAFSGMTRLTSFPGRPPVGPGFSYADHAAGLYASMSLLGALEHRRRTGEGLSIDISEVEVMQGLLDDSLNGRHSGPAGNRSPVGAPHGVYPCRGKDRWCAITVFNDTGWRGLKKAMGSPARAEDKKFATPAGRLKNRAALDALVSGWTKRFTADKVTQMLQKNGVAAGLVQDAAGIARDLQLRSRGFFIDAPEIGRLVDASPLRLSGTPARYSLSAPPPGRDNDYVYGRLLGLSQKEMAELTEKGVI